MKSILTRSLPMFAAALLLTAVTSSNLTAQIVISSPDDIVVPGAGEAEAFFDAATGDVFLALGSDLLIAGITNEDFIFTNFDNTTELGGGDPNEIQEIAFLTLPAPFGEPLPTGIFNIGNVLPANPDITDIPSFLAEFGNVDDEDPSRVGPQAQFSDGVGQFRPFNVIVSTEAIPEPGSLSLLALAGLGVVARRRR